MTAWVYSPAPDVGSPVLAHLLLHEFCNTNVLYAMVTSQPAGAAVHLNDFLKELQNSICSVVVMDPEADDDPSLAINEPMDHNFPLNQP